MIENTRNRQNDEQVSSEPLFSALRERAKELNCVYEIESILAREDKTQDEALQAVAELLPTGLQYDDIAAASIDVGATSYHGSRFQPTHWMMEAPILMQGEPAGRIRVCYLEARPVEALGPFMLEEERLLRSVADRLGHYLLYKRVRRLWQRMDAAGRDPDHAAEKGWQVVMRMLKGTDPQLARRIGRKMLNLLCAMGVAEAQEVLHRMENVEADGRENVPALRLDLEEMTLPGRPFKLAATYLTDSEILSRIQKWMQEDRAGFLFKVLSNPRSTLADIANAMHRVYHVLADGIQLSESWFKSLRVTLTHRLLTEQLEFNQVARDVVRVRDFRDVLQHVVMSTESHGKLGGKAAGLLLSYWILSRAEDELLAGIKMPRTWYVASDAVLEFFNYNELEDVWEQKFKDLATIRREYPNIIQLFKNSTYPPDLSKGLSIALDDLGPVPLVVRSSSLLEDRLGTAFSGKYKSLFLANQGSKEERLAALQDAIAEIYASLLGPDPIEYRRERGLLEFDEQMGILIQEVIGRRVGKYWVPAFAGVAFSRNEFRWSPRIRRDDGLVRMVPGLGTRAVDRVGEDFPTLLVPGQPNLRVNVDREEIIRYSANMIDALNLETNSFDTLTIQSLLRDAEGDFPMLDKVFSVQSRDLLRKPVPLLFDPEKDEVVTTFQGLVDETPFLQQVRSILTVLETAMNTPVDVEFAHDGKDFYILQCRPQSQAQDVAPAPIPQDIPPADLIFDSHRHVSNGYVPDLTHVVYVDPAAYAALPDEASLRAVGRAVSVLNGVLPKRQFVLMGPGRWGSRGDLKLGVNITYADICNTSLLVEMAWGKGKTMPDLSFGTHFFQDLVESHIRYLPLYPGESGTVFCEDFFRTSPNLLAELAPEYAYLSECIRVIDVPTCTGGRILRVLLNADLERAVAILAEPDQVAHERQTPRRGLVGAAQERHWFWRLRMAEKIAAEMDAEALGVVAVYVFGSAKNASAGPGSDIDLLIHVRQNIRQRAELLAWLDGWSRCLAEMNYLETGIRSEGLLDVHLITDEDIEQRTSWAAKIDAVTDAARPLPVGTSRRV
ncbi:MAG: PEP/pyruvate-binding domain-containing protein [Candidatus Krumholzibacteria bacterium]|jgi:predicted nucleotidyltransferase|nr:PEP/pyruvate-binding domain-containing protein [Candidatus Krumholzibacteria bacterium]